MEGTGTHQEREDMKVEARNHAVCQPEVRWCGRLVGWRPSRALDSLKEGQFLSLGPNSQVLRHYCSNNTSAAGTTNNASISTSSLPFQSPVVDHLTHAIHVNVSAIRRLLSFRFRCFLLRARCCSSYSRDPIRDALLISC